MLGPAVKSMAEPGELSFASAWITADGVRDSVDDLSELNSWALPVQIDRSFLSRLRRVSIIEGVSTLVLFGLAMPLKYFAGLPVAVTIAGSVHGFLFVVLVAMFAIGLKRIPLPVGLAAIGVVAAVLPFGPFVIDRRLARVGTDEGA